MFTLKNFEFPDKQGQTGIISCLSVNPHTPSVYAAGSYTRSGEFFLLTYWNN